MYENYGLAARMGTLVYERCEILCVFLLTGLAKW